MRAQRLNLKQPLNLTSIATLAHPSSVHRSLAPPLSMKRESLDDAVGQRLAGLIDLSLPFQDCRDPVGSRGR